MRISRGNELPEDLRRLLDGPWVDLSRAAMEEGRRKREDERRQRQWRRVELALMVVVPTVSPFIVDWLRGMI